MYGGKLSMLFFAFLYEKNSILHRENRQQCIDRSLKKKKKNSKRSL